MPPCARMSSLTGESTLRLDGLDVRVRHVRPPAPADAPPVLVLHGWGASIGAVGSIVDGLADRLEVVALDLPGFGESAEPPEPWDVGAYARLVLRACDELGLERFSVVGHSFGARVGIVLAATHPERIARMLLTGAAGIKPRRKPSYYAKVAVAKAGRVIGALGGAPGRRLQDRMRRRVASSDWLEASEAMRGTFRRVIAEDLSPHLPHIRAATLLVWGERDEDTPLWMGRRMEAAIPDAGLVVLDGGHYAYAERAAEFNRIAAHFLTAA
jgi:pimeloyl-ACP methyl ester carboxylesterase